MNWNYQSEESKNSSNDKIQGTFLLGAMLLIAIYTIARYRGMWGETDTASFAQSMRA